MIWLWPPVEKTLVSRIIGTGARPDEVRKHLAGANQGKLIDVTDDQKGGVARDRLEQRVHQQNVHHRRLVDNEEIVIEGVVRTASDPPVCRINLENG